ncbi:MAG: hypothetical protein MJZ68_02895 [archaeon]|nr:hypothetical protein [archaeon]
MKASRPAAILVAVIAVVVGAALATSISDADDPQGVSISALCFDGDARTFTVSGECSEDIVHIGVFSDGSKAMEAFAPVSDGRYVQTVDVSALAPVAYTVKVWDASVENVYSVDLTDIVCADFDRAARTLSVSGLAADGTLHLGVFDASGAKVHEFYTVSSDGSFSVVVDLEGMAAGDYTVRAWDGQVTVTAQKAFVIFEPLYRLVFPEGVSVSSYGTDVVSGDLIEAGAVLTVSANVVSGKYALIGGADMVDGTFTMPMCDVELDVEYLDTVSLGAVSYDKAAKVLTVAGAAYTDTVHIGVWSGPSKVVEAFAPVTDGSYAQDVLLEGLGYGDYTVKVWDASASCVQETDFIVSPAAYRLVFAEGIAVGDAGVPVLSGSDVVAGTVLSVTVDGREGHTAVLDIVLDDGVFTMPDHDVTISVEYTVNVYTVTFMVGDEVFETVSLEYGTTVTAPVHAPAVPEGKVFAGWDGLTPETAVTGDMVFRAVLDDVPADGSLSVVRTVVVAAVTMVLVFLLRNLLR